MGTTRYISILVKATTMDPTSRVTWRDIPITRINTNKYNTEETNYPKQTPAKSPSGERVTWNENLLDIRNISPRIKTDNFKFPVKPKQSKTYCSHFTCRAGHPCRQTNSGTATTSSKKPTTTTTSQLNCSPQMQKVVFRAVNQSPNQKENANYDWRPQSNNLHESKNYLKGSFI